MYLCKPELEVMGEGVTAMLRIKSNQVTRANEAIISLAAYLHLYIMFQLGVSITLHVTDSLLMGFLGLHTG